MSLTELAARNIAWTTATNLSSRIVALLGTILITRYVAPDVYGEVAIALTLVRATNLLSSLGIMQYIVAKPTAGRDAVFHVVVFYLAAGVAGWVLVVAIGPGALALLDAPTAWRFVPWVIASTVLARLASIPERILWRDLRFASSGIGRSIAELTYTGVAVTLAVRGWGGLALVIGNIARYAVQVVLFNLMVDRREWLSPCTLRWEQTRRIFSFGLPLSVVAIVDNASQEWDNLIFSRLFGPRVVGLYNLAYNLADLPSTYIGEQIGDVLLPTFARVQGDRRRDGLVRATGLMALLIAPVAIGLATVAPTAVQAIFDPRWAMMGPMLTVLSALTLARPFAWLLTAYMQANDQPRAAMLAELFKVAVLFGAIVALSRWGPVSTCWAIGIAFGGHAALCIAIVTRSDRVPAGKLVTRILLPALSCIPMVGGVLGLRAALRGTIFDGTIPGLVLEVAVGAVLFVPSAVLVARSSSRELIRLLGRLLRRRTADDEDNGSRDDGNGDGGDGSGPVDSR